MARGFPLDSAIAGFIILSLCDHLFCSFRPPGLLCLGRCLWETIIDPICSLECLCNVVELHPHLALQQRHAEVMQLGSLLLLVKYLLASAGNPNMRMGVDVSLARGERLPKAWSSCQRDVWKVMAEKLLAVAESYFAQQKRAQQEKCSWCW